MSELVGRRIASYRLQKLINQGNALVYLATDERNSRQVAIKLLPTTRHDEAAMTRFIRGAQGITDLHHAHIVPLYEHGAADGYYYMAMRYIKGGSLGDLMRRQGPLEPGSACDLIRQIADALQFAHKRGIYHRDIKPSNILLSPDRKTAYLADFGIAQIMGQETVTEFGKLVGTPEFMSPEQVRGGDLDGRSDIYSLGITLYAALTGKLPFRGEAATVLYHHVFTEPWPVRKVNRAIPRSVENIVKKATAKQPGERYQSAAEMSRALRSTLVTTGSRPGLWLVMGLLVVILVVLALASRGPDSRDSPGTSTNGSGDTMVAKTTATPLRPRTTSTTGPTARPTSTPRLTAMTPVTNVPPTSGPGQTTISTAGTPNLSAPAAGARFETGHGERMFSWAWAGDLASNEHFEIRFYEGNGSFHEAPFGWIKESSQSINLDLLKMRGELEWQVVLIQGRNGNLEKTVALSARRPLLVEGP